MKGCGKRYEEETARNGKRKFGKKDYQSMQTYQFILLGHAMVNISFIRMKKSRMANACSYTNKNKVEKFS